MYKCENVKIAELKVDENCSYLPGDNSSIIAAVALIKTTSINIMLEMFRHLFIDIVKGWARCCRSIVVILNGMHALCLAQNTQNVCRFMFGKSVAMTCSLCSLLKLSFIRLFIFFLLLFLLFCLSLSVGM